MKKLPKIFLLALILIPLSGYFILKYVAEPAKMVDDGMSPTIERGQYFWFERISIKFSTLQRGDMVVYTEPNAVDGGYFWQQLVGRVVGVPGESVQLKEGKVFIDGVELGEDYADTDALRSGRLEEEINLPEGHYIILADNRVRGEDSRSVGLVPRSHIKGKVFVWY